jgi:copper resistance protein C
MRIHRLLIAAGVFWGAFITVMASSLAQTPLQVIATDPESDASVKAPLTMIHVMFSGQIDANASGFEVTRADGTRVDVGAPVALGTSMLMATPKAPLPAGTYKVKWHTVGTDAKKLEGEFTFKVQ